MIVASATVRPYPGQSVSGDAFVVESTTKGLLLAVVDALGHGPIAAEVATLAVATIRANTSASPAAVLRACHDALLRGRGAAISIVTIDHQGHGVFAGVGNVRARVHPDSLRAPALLPVAGTIGHQLRTIRETSFTLPLDGVGVIHSDGVSSRIDPLSMHASRVEDAAGELLATHARDIDDACVVVFAHRSNPRFASVRPARAPR